jgi:hypothetical protein
VKNHHNAATDLIQHQPAAAATAQQAAEEAAAEAAAEVAARLQEPAPAKVGRRHGSTTKRVSQKSIKCGLLRYGNFAALQAV